MAGLTRAELGQLIKDTCGPMIAEAVKEQWSKTPAAGMTQEMIARMTGESSTLSSGQANGTGTAPVKVREKGAAAWRIVLASAAAKMQNRGGDAVLDILRSWGDGDLADALLVAREMQQKTLLAGSPGDGGILIPPTFSTDIIELLRPASIVRRMNPTMVPMPTGTVRIPKITAGSTATYIGESVNIPTSTVTFGQVVLSYKKLTAMVPISNDLIRYATIGAPESIVRDDIVRSIATRENQAFLRDPGGVNTPTGLLNQAAAANRIATTGTWVATLANCLIDLGAAQRALMNNNIPMTRCGWLMSPNHYLQLSILTTATGQYVFRDELARGLLWGYPYAISTHVPGAAGAAELYFADFADVVVGDSMRLIVDSSMEASYFDGTQLQSSFSLDQTVVRAISEADLGLRRAESVAVITGGTV